MDSEEAEFAAVAIMEQEEELLADSGPASEGGQATGGNEEPPANDEAFEAKEGAPEVQRGTPKSKGGP